MFGSRESERKMREEEREERKEKQNLKIKDFIYKNKNLQKILPKIVASPIVFFLLQKKRGLYRPPQGMKIPKKPMKLAKL